jgi:hypothetical protein
LTLFYFFFCFGIRQSDYQTELQKLEDIFSMGFILEDEYQQRKADLAGKYGAFFCLFSLFFCCCCCCDKVAQPIGITLTPNVVEPTPVTTLNPDPVQVLDPPVLHVDLPFFGDPHPVPVEPFIHERPSFIGGSRIISFSFK